LKVLIFICLFLALISCTNKREIKNITQKEIYALTDTVLIKHLKSNYNITLFEKKDLKGNKILPVGLFRDMISNRRYFFSSDSGPGKFSLYIFSYSKLNEASSALGFFKKNQSYLTEKKLSGIPVWLYLCGNHLLQLQFNCSDIPAGKKSIDSLYQNLFSQIAIDSFKAGCDIN